MQVYAFVVVVTGDGDAQDAAAMFREQVIEQATKQDLPGATLAPRSFDIHVGPIGRCSA